MKLIFATEGSNSALFDCRCKMAENVRLGELSEILNNPIMPNATNDTRHQYGLLMTHAMSGIRQVPMNSTIRSFNFGARSVEHSRRLADNISSTIGEIRPLIEHARVGPGISLGSLLNVQRNQAPIRANPPPTDSYVIDMENLSSNSGSSQIPQFHDYHHHHHHHHHHQPSNNSPPNNASESTNESRNDTEDESTEAWRIRLDTRVLLQTLRHMPFVMMLIGKGIYDHSSSILNFIVLFGTFSHANNVLKREIAKQQNHSWISLLTITCYIVACIVFITRNLGVHIFWPYAEPVTVWELLWSVLVMDFVLKLMTIICKVILTCLPAQILALQKRGKYYLMVEATSQLYRCIAPVQPWLYYLLEASQGPAKLSGVVLSTLYTVSKTNDLLLRVELFCTAIWKLLQNVNLGVAPSKEQLIASGGICPICHEEYLVPVRLHCKHIFCESCVSTWLDRKRSCPLCRAAITDDRIYRDGHTAYFVQLY